MCLTFCHRLYQEHSENQEHGEAVLFWNHASCVSAGCAYAPGYFPSTWRCANCRHQDAENCGLTGQPQPRAGGCCHYNVTVATGEIAVDRMLAEPWQGVTVAEVLDYMAASYREAEGRTFVDPAELAYAVPATYGRGTEERTPEPPQPWATTDTPEEPAPVSSAGLRWWE